MLRTARCTRGDGHRPVTRDVFEKLQADRAKETK
jgi:hypothetical protein